MIVLGILFSIPMFFVLKNSVMYDVLFALVTGITASFGVSICMEISNNYRQNKKRELELDEYFMFFHSYEINKAIQMGNEKFYHLDITKEEWFEPLDEIQVIWKALPELIPLFQKTVDEKKEFLSFKEVESLQYILDEFQQIKREIEMFLLPGVVDAQMNEMDLDFLDSWIPANLKKELSDEYLKQLCELEFEEALHKVVDKIFANSIILGVSLEEDIPVGEQYLDKEDCENMESSIISMQCKNILDEIEMLEKEVMKQARAGYLLREAKRGQKKEV